jgi:hypothetical protein
MELVVPTLMVAVAQLIGALGQCSPSPFVESHCVKKGEVDMVVVALIASAAPVALPLLDLSFPFLPESRQ